MFLRFKQDNATRTVDLNHVHQVHKTQHWGGENAYMIRVDFIGNYAVIADKLTEDQANAIESQLIEAWTQKRDQIGILEIKNENLS